MLFEKKILILVLSYDQPPFSQLMSAQKETWYADPVENVETFFYYGGLEKYFPGGVMQWPDGGLQFDITDDYYLMAGKFKRALQFIHDAGIEYDLIFRTNSSSYVNKKRLKNFCTTLPLQKVYGGWTVCDSNFDGGYCVSGAGIFLSKDYADILRREIDENEQIEEDVYVGRILRAHGARPFDDQSRLDYSSDPYFRGESYHIRFKSHDRMKDAENMKKFHQKIIHESIR